MPEDNGLLFLDAAAAEGDWAPLYTSEEDGSAYIMVQDEAAEGADSLEQQLDAFLAGIDDEQVRHTLVMPPAQLGWASPKPCAWSAHFHMTCMSDKHGIQRAPCPPAVPRRRGACSREQGTCSGPRWKEDRSVTP